jgi:hypothetical protein
MGLFLSENIAAVSYDNERAKTQIGSGVYCEGEQDRLR